jgi:hypothetical protein
VETLSSYAKEVKSTKTRTRTGLLEGFNLVASLGLGFGITALIQRFQSFFIVSIVFGTLATFATSLFLTMVLGGRASTFSNFSLTDLYRSCVSALLVFCFLVLLPINVDRSFSVWGINSIYKAAPSHSMDFETFEAKMSNFFLDDPAEFERRIDEQSKLGNLRRTGDSVSLTIQGAALRDFFAILSKFFNLNPKYAQ